MKWLAAHTWLIALVPLVAVILLSYYTGKPFNLLQDTEVDYLDKDTVLAMHLQSEGQERAKTIRYIATIEDGSRILLYLQKDSLPMPSMGDMLMVQTTISRGGVLGDFDYGTYLRRQGIVGSGWANRRNWQAVGHQDIKGIRALAQKCQYTLHQRYTQMGLQGKELGIVSALTLGYREELDKKVQQSFSASGAMHVLAVSGLHTGIVWSIVIWILTLGGWRKPLYEERWKRWLLSSTIIILLWAYAFITGLSPSVMRSALMLTFLELSFLFNRHTSHWNPLFAAAFIILLINPLALWSISFQLSFAAVASIMWIGSKMQWMVILRGKVLQYIGGLLIVSLAAQIGTIPLTLHYFGQTSNYFALTNLIVIPMAYILLILGISTLAMSWCIVGKWLGFITQWCTWTMREAVEWIESLPFSTTQISISEWSVIGLYGAVICGALMLRGKKVQWWWLLGVMVSLGVIIFCEVLYNRFY